MKRFLTLLVIVSVAALIGCSSEKSAENTAEDLAAQTEDLASQAKDKAADAIKATTKNVTDHFMEVACGSCIYGMEGVEGCVAAVKVNDEPVLLTGVPVDAHGLGLCKEPKKAHIHGAVKDGKYVASEVKFE